MEYIKFVITLLSPMIMVALAESDHSEFEAEVMAELGKLAQKNVELEMDLETTKVELKSMEKKFAAIQSERTYEAFDCYRTESWDTNGIITFNGCSVDLTTQDPWTGSFMVPETGLWRFTSMATAYADDPSGYGYVRIRVDGSYAAISYLNPDGGATGRFPISINTLQQLEAGQIVTIEWTGYNGAYLYSGSSEWIHWTGTYMQSGTIVPPACEYTGQTFEYPGSCRKYWLCLADGSIDVFDCCPDVYVPDAEACLSEDLIIVDTICHSEDVCA